MAVLSSVSIKKDFKAMNIQTDSMNSFVEGGKGAISSLFSIMNNNYISKLSENDEIYSMDDVSIKAPIPVLLIN